MTSPFQIDEAPNIIRLLSNPAGMANVNEDQAKGTILGLAVGNLLGLPVEGWSAVHISQSFPNGVTQIDPLERVRPMDDDLAQAVDLAEALAAGVNFVPDFCSRLVRWRREERPRHRNHDICSD